METGQFTDMNHAVEKFVNINTKAVSSRQISYYKQQNRGFYRGNKGKLYQNKQRCKQINNGNNNNGNNFRGRQYRGRSNSQYR